MLRPGPHRADAVQRRTPTFRVPSPCVADAPLGAPSPCLGTHHTPVVHVVLRHVPPRVLALVPPSPVLQSGLWSVHFAHLFLRACVCSPYLLSTDEC